MLGMLTHAQAHTHNNTPTLNGTTGLNVVPSARMLESGRITIGAATKDPFLSSFAGLQIADPLQITIRQTAHISSLRDSALALHPGIDAKLRLWRESDLLPDLAIGAQGILGDREMRSPYIVASKRIDDFDFSLGKGWGRYDRGAGIFGGVEYFLPLQGLSLKLDYDPQSYRNQSALDGFTRSTPIGFGLSYRHQSGLSAAIGAHGGDSIFTRLSYNFNPAEMVASDNAPRNRFHSTGWGKRAETIPPSTLSGTHATHPLSLSTSAYDEGIFLSYADLHDGEVKAGVHLDTQIPTAKQIGRSARIIAHHAPESIKTVTITPHSHGFEGMSLTFSRADFDKLNTGGALSPQEIWHNSRTARTTYKSPRSTYRQTPEINLILREEMDFSARHNGVFTRSSAIINTEHSMSRFGLLAHAGLRLNMNSTLDAYYGQSMNRNTRHGRSDITAYAQRTGGFDNLMLSKTLRLGDNLYAMASAGYLDEVYGGAGAQILYRPYDARWGLGAQFWHARKRDPNSDFSLNFIKDADANAALIEGWYDLPRDAGTLHARAGYFLGGDNGAQLSIEKTFKNNVRLELMSAISVKQATHITGDETRTRHMARLVIPVGREYFKDIMHTRAEFKIGEMASDLTQTPDTPHVLYNMTTPLTLNHLTRHWDSITE